MSGAYIKNMKKPDMCGHCRFVDAFDCGVDGTFIEEHSVVRPDCPLVFLPEHGDLIDIDAYRDEFMDGVYTECCDDPDNARANRIIDLYDTAPVIIPADIETMYYPQVDGITPTVIKPKKGETE